MPRPRSPSCENSISEEPSVPVLTGDTLVTMNGWSVSFMKLPSGRNPTMEPWFVDLLFHGWSAAIHPPSNAVAVSEDIGPIPNVPIHILKMDTGTPHPSAAGGSTLRVDLQSKFKKVRCPHISINKTTLAVLFEESDEKNAVNADELVVWNWTTGSMIHREANTFYDVITLVSDTWLVAGYACLPPGSYRGSLSPGTQGAVQDSSNDRFPEFALDLINTSVEPIQKTRFRLRVPSRFRSDGHFFGLNSGESVSHDPSRVIITARIHNHDKAAQGIAVYCITLPLGKLLELANAKQGGDIPWEEWGIYASTSERIHTKHVFSDYSASGRRLIGPLEQVGPKDLEIEIHEFHHLWAPLISPSDGNSSADTDSAPLTEMVEGEGDKRPPLKPIIVRFTMEVEDLTELWTILTIRDDDLVVVSRNPVNRAWSMKSFPLPDIRKHLKLPGTVPDPPH